MDLQQLALAIQAVSEPVRLELERIGEQHSCILAGAALIEALKRKGYQKAYPLTVRAIIVNPLLVDRVLQSGFPSDEKVKKQWVEEGGRWIGLGSGPEGPGRGQWDGHLAVIIPQQFGDRHALCDLTLPQADKPDWGINLCPLLLRVSDSFVNGSASFKAPVKGSLVTYWAFPNDHSFDATPAWQNKQLHNDIVDHAFGVQ